MTLGEQIKNAREAKNLSQEELADQIGVTRQAISKWENDLSVPHGINRELLGKTLELEWGLDEEQPDQERELATLSVARRWMWAGWIMAAILLIVCIAIMVLRPDTDAGESTEEKTENNQTERDSTEQSQTAPVIKSIRFYDENLEEVFDEALWYNTAGIEFIMIEWDKLAPDSIQMFFCPSGTETAEMTELLMTKLINDGGTVALLSAEPLKSEDRMGHLYFQLDFGNILDSGNTIITSDQYQVFYDQEWLESGDEG